MRHKSCSLIDLQDHAGYLAHLLVIGAVQLARLAESSQQVSFPTWSEAVAKALDEEGTKFDEGQLEWLWEALTTEPRIGREVGGHILSREEQWKTQEPIPVLKKGETLGVFLKSFTSFGAPVFSVPPNVQPDGMITLLGPLTMGAGKAGHLECRDVKATVEIPVEKARSLDEEAVLMKLERIDVVVQRNMVMAWVRSLNHAFTVTSRRLQPHRRSHGGRIYDHIAWRKDNQWISLEAIRCQVEAGKWNP